MSGRPFPSDRSLVQKHVETTDIIKEVDQAKQRWIFQDRNRKIIHQSASSGYKNAIYRPDHQKYLNIAGRRPQEEHQIFQQTP
jgi:hypothetical protein